MIQEKIQKALQEVEQYKITGSSDTEEFRLKFLSKKGEINALIEEFKTVLPEQKRVIGQELNQLKLIAQQKWEAASQKFSSASTVTKNVIDDFTLTTKAEFTGSRHPLTIVSAEINKIFKKLGFSYAEGPEIEDDWHNFTALNFPKDHPARDMQDTFFIGEEIALRTHTSSVQVRIMQNEKPPIRSIMPGRVYRNEAISARANCFFHQVEGIFIDEQVSFKDLKQTLFYFVKEFFGEDIRVRFRPSYFPFTEPSAEMDISCVLCNGKGCSVCKQTGWLEILGCGMIDPQVLKSSGIDSSKFSGFAFGMGIERMAMLKFGIKDLRTYFQNDIRFLNQFYPLS